MVDTELVIGVYVCAVRGYAEGGYVGKKYWNWTGTDGLLSLRVSMATGFGEARCPEMGIRLLLSVG